MSRMTQQARASRGHTTSSRTGAISRRIRGAAGQFLGRPRARGRIGRGRGRGISKTELRGFRKVVALLRKVGMVPKGTRKAPVRRS